MSTYPAPTAQVYDLRPSHLPRLVERQSLAGDAHPAAVLDDLADAVEAIHACANLAGFSERSRSLLFALATCAHARCSDYVELFDQELADLQGCSTKTVQRQRADYLREACALKFDLVGVVEGEFDRDANQHAATRYRFLVGETVARIVADARKAEGWGALDRKRQREAIRRAAARVYEDIPDAPPRRRKGKRPRKASAEVETCQKIVRKQLEKLRDRASRLPRPERTRLLEEPGDLCSWWLEVRADMDAFCAVDSPQTAETSEVDGGGGQFVHHPPDDEPVETEASPEARAEWDKLEARLTEPRVRSVRVDLRPPAPVPRELPGRADGEMTVEELEAEAVRAEACGEREP
jgi:hypothetical protein